MLVAVFAAGHLGVFEARDSFHFDFDPQTLPHTAFIKARMSQAQSTADPVAIRQGKCLKPAFMNADYAGGCRCLQGM